MNKSNDVLRFFNFINQENNVLKRHSENVIQNLHDYLTLHDEVKHCVVSKLTDSDARFFIMPFNLTVSYRGSYKLFEVEKDVSSYCYEMTFFNIQDKEEIIYFTAYITGDEYLVSNVNQPGSICQVYNENRGQKVFARILDNLYKNKIISI